VRSRSRIRPTVPREHNSSRQRLNLLILFVGLHLCVQYGSAITTNLDRVNPPVTRPVLRARYMGSPPTSRRRSASMPSVPGTALAGISSQKPHSVLPRSAFSSDNHSLLDNFYHLTGWNLIKPFDVESCSYYTFKIAATPFTYPLPLSYDSITVHFRVSQFSTEAIQFAHEPGCCFWARYHAVAFGFSGGLDDHGQYINTVLTRCRCQRLDLRTNDSVIVLSR